MRKKSILFKVLIVVCVSICCFFLSGYKTKAYTNHTQLEAVQWAQDKALTNPAWEVDFDGKWGCQCVDLIYAYMYYLTGSYDYGYGYAYQFAEDSHAIPPGWQRLPGSTTYPEPRRYCCME